MWPPKIDFRFGIYIEKYIGWLIKSKKVLATSAKVHLKKLPFFLFFVV